MSELARELRTVALLLAAGLSTRHPNQHKLLRPLNDLALGLHAANTLTMVPMHHRLVVCSAATAGLAPSWSALGFEVLTNEAPHLGMATSLRMGIARAVELDADSVLVALADMPNITKAHLEALLARCRQATGHDLVATRNAETGVISPPAIFERQYFARLLNLTGDHGGRVLLNEAEPVQTDGATLKDFDTPADFGD